MTLAGQQWIREVKEAEAVRYIRECLVQHPDISGIADAHAEFDGSTLTIRCTAVTSYGNTDIEVNYNNVRKYGQERHTRSNTGELWR